MALLAPVLALTHGGGPLPLMDVPSQAALAASLRTRGPAVLGLAAPRPPRALCVVTAHWQTAPGLRVNAAARPKLLFDYRGFPPETYEYTYDAPGDPEVAGWVAAALREGGFEVAEDTERGRPLHFLLFISSFLPSPTRAHAARLTRQPGWDHGVFVPLKLVAPAGTTPVVALSVPRPPHDAAALLALGRALAPLRARNVAILGSGAASFHNVRALFGGAAARADVRARHARWAAALRGAVAVASVEGRAEALEGWQRWEGAAEAHPVGAEEHFAPLLVCAGAAGDGEVGTWEDEMEGMSMVNFYWT